ncbi:MAG: preprotein translocase subunit SecG [Acidobacteriota bacterium]
MYYILMTLFILSCFVLIIFVLLQPGKSDASAVFGGGASSTAFGPRGTQTVLAKITIAAAIIFFLIAFLFSIPGLFTKRSVSEGVAPEAAAPAPAPTEQPLPLTPQPKTPAAPATQNATTPAGNSSTKPEEKKPEAPKPNSSGKAPDKNKK